MRRDLAYFFRQDRTISFRALKKSDRVRLTRNLKDGSRFISESLSSLVPDSRMIPCLAEFRPGEESCEFTPKIFPGFEFVYIMEGSVCLTTPTDRQMLTNGDVGWIDGRTRRQYISTGEEGAKAMIVTFPAGVAERGDQGRGEPARTTMRIASRAISPPANKPPMAAAMASCAEAV